MRLGKEAGERQAEYRQLFRARIQDKTLDEIMEISWVLDAFRPLYERHLKSIEIIRNKSQYSGKTIYFDISEFDLEGYNKFIPYYLFPEAVYCVGVSLSSYRTKISVFLRYRLVKNHNRIFLSL